MRRQSHMLEKKEYAAQRLEMIEKQLRRRGINDASVLGAMTAVPRHEFVAEELRPHAYDDLPLPIGGGQTTSPPFLFVATTPPFDLPPNRRGLAIPPRPRHQSPVHLAPPTHAFPP